MVPLTPSTSIRALSALALTLLAACDRGSTSTAVHAAGGEEACEYCGVVEAPHMSYRTRARWLEDLPPAQLDLVRADLRGQGVPVQSAELVCPRSFGPIPAPDEVRIVPLESESGPDLWRRKWAVVGRDPWAWQFVTMWHAVLGDVLRPEARRFDSDADRVWLLELRVERRVEDDGRMAAKCSLIWSPSSGTSTVTAGTSDWIAETPTLDQLVMATSARQLVSFPSEVVLAVVDGNPVRLTLREEGPPEDEQERKDLLLRSPADPLHFRYPWLERMQTRVRAGERGQPVF